MKHFIFIAAMLAPIAAFAQSDANSSSASNAGSVAQTGSITFHGSHQADRVATTPPVYTSPSMFGQGTCGSSNSAGVSITGFGFGGSVATDDPACDARADAATAWNLGLKDVAVVRFMCFGEDANRLAYESLGYQCPDGSTAKGIETQAGYQGNDPIVRARLARQ